MDIFQRNENSCGIHLGDIDLISRTQYDLGKLNCVIYHILDQTIERTLKQFDICRPRVDRQRTETL